MKALAKTGLTVACAAVLILLIGGCANFPITPASPPMGGTFSNLGYPTDITFNDTRIGNRTGKAKMTHILGFTFGDCSVAGAARNGGIDEVAHIESEFLNVLGIYSTYTTIVYSTN